jgi:hypothetical protein
VWDIDLQGVCWQLSAQSAAARGWHECARHAFTTLLQSLPAALLQSVPVVQQAASATSHCVDGNALLVILSLHVLLAGVA